MGPLHGYRIIELAGLGPGPFCGMMLADMGAEVIQIVRPTQDQQEERPLKVDQRGRRSLALDLKKPAAVEIVLRLCENADALFEGFRPGVVERLGLGPDVCMTRNPKLVFGRMTGWGQEGPLAERAGHDINYLALSGALHNLGRRGEKPAVPLNYVADYGGGGMMLAFGLLCGILSAQKNGKGQVVDAAMVDGVAALQAFHYQMYHNGMYLERGEHFLGGGHHSYDVYETRDGEYLAVGAIEAKFYAQLIEILELDSEQFAHKSICEEVLETEVLQELQVKMTEVFKTRSRDEWVDVFAETDACVTPVLSLEEAAQHPHNAARQTFIRDEQGVLQHAPAPRFSETPAVMGNAPRYAGEDRDGILRDYGFSEDAIAQYAQAGVFG